MAVLPPIDYPNEDFGGKKAHESICENCGFISSGAAGSLGLPVCDQCGHILHFPPLRPEAANVSGELQSQPSALLADCEMEQVPFPDPRNNAHHWAALRPRKFFQNQRKFDEGLHRCQIAIERFSGVLGMASAQKAAKGILVRHVQLVRKGFPSKPLALKRLVTASVYVASLKLRLGLCMNEAAVKAGMSKHHLARMVWKVCRQHGIRDRRPDTSTLLDRLCIQCKITRQKGTVHAAAARIVEICEGSWVATGRNYPAVVTAAFLWAAKAYHFAVPVDVAAGVLCLSHNTVSTRHKEIADVLASSLRILPWGHLVTPATLHLYMFFALDYFQTLSAISTERRQLQIGIERNAADVPPRLTAD
mmetsp:Transcript_51577/g.122694  ORF Transcript_51577/g.122694 Transcript_51577/m.122694 type:complete len:362 (-) Transcript_51577:104-1189(-)